ncbi:aldo/keto reductase [Bifidobacterium choloepi]|uniref:Aldo/keto reductase n=1 Tax=Bifidobacterium choloepi TaxID=2614131 RepID=A0A6I5NCF0_9BIFI|nr:aldo/keto reductase [Bifidobacterium choloepi]NEG70210.1 aldo/keto reductase [Bifidobacterium choloepi]
MHKIALNNELLIPEIGFGVFEIPDGKATEDAVRAAIHTGYRLIDTAAVYGNEAAVGEAIHTAGVPREELFITTKVWNDDIRKGTVKQAFEESLAKLGLDYVDLYLIHWPAEGWQQAWRDLQDLYASGRAKAIGVSNFERHHLEALLDAPTTEVVPAVDQVESSPQFPNTDLVDFCKSRGIVVEAYKPLGGHEGVAALSGDRRLRDVGEKYGKSPAQVALRWQLQRGVIPLPKSTRETRIVQNYHVFDFELSPEDMAVVDSVAGTDGGRRNGSDPDNFDF